MTLGWPWTQRRILNSRMDSTVGGSDFKAISCIPSTNTLNFPRKFVSENNRVCCFHFSNLDPWDHRLTHRWNVVFVNTKSTSRSWHISENSWETHEGVCWKDGVYTKKRSLWNYLWKPFYFEGIENLRSHLKTDSWNKELKEIKEIKEIKERKKKEERIRSKEL